MKKCIFSRMLLIISVLVFSLKLGIAQKLEEGTTFMVDHLENRYYLSGDVFSNVTSTYIMEYQKSFLGKISVVDVSNPLRILVFFRNSNALVFLNNELSEINEPIYLDELDLVDVPVICSSNINGFWVFNQIKSRIEFYNENLKLIHYSNDLSSIITDIDQLRSMQINGKYLYLNLYNRGIMVFDMFANYIKTIPVRQANSFQVFNNGTVLYAQDGVALSYDNKRLKTDTIFVSSSQIDYIRMYNQTVYYQSNDSLIIRRP